MLSFLKRLRSDKRGNVLLIASAAFPLLVGAAGLATDTIQWTLWKRQLQRAADSAALAGVYQRVQAGDLTAVKSAVTRDLAINNHTGIGLVATYPKVALPADSGDLHLQVSVQLALQKRLVFSSMFMSSPPTIVANATAASVPGTDEYCVVSLEKSASKTGITGSGNASVEMNCGMVTNSPAANSAIAKGSVVMKATVIASVGGIQQSNNWQVGKYDPYVAAQKDPYKDVTPDPADMKCAATSSIKKVKGVDTVVWTPVALTETTDVANAKDQYGHPANCFSSLSIGSGQSKTLPPGTYYINGGDAFIQGNLTATNSTIVLTNIDPVSTTIGQFKVNADSNVNITAPTATSDKFRGIAIYQDRRAVDSASSNNKINGNSTSQIIGALYFPNQELDYNGTGTTTAICTRFVTRRIIFSGNSGTSNKFEKDCPGAGLDPIEGGRRVRLVA